MAQAASRRRPRRRVVVAPVETDPYRLAFEHAAIGVAILDPDGDAVSVNGALRALLGREPQDVAALVGMVHRDEQAGLDERLRAVATGAMPTVVSEHRLEHPDGTDRCVRLHVSGAHDHAGELVAVVLHAVDVTEQRERARELLHQTLHDALTGLPNRTLLRDRLGHALSRGARADAPRVALLYLDLDRFKDVNDSLGHAGGDTALVEAANRLRAAVRPSDTVARIGGDEFVVCCEDISHTDEAVNMAARILTAMRVPFHPDGDELRLSTSIGIAFARRPDTTADELLREADRALYTAKRAGRDRYAVHAPPPCPFWRQLRAVDAHQRRRNQGRVVKTVSAWWSTGPKWVSSTQARFR